jgi:17beta-estradiol 17-dehydrogenase/3beta-hydroxysteroid 3-dehydrogenase/mitotic-spindle organizing protein 1
MANEFSSRFADSYTSSNAIRLFNNPSAVNINDAPAQMQMEVTELQSNDFLKDVFRRKSAAILCRTPCFKFLTIKTFEKKMITVFGSTYICEQAFSVMNYKK